MPKKSKYMRLGVTLIEIMVGLLVIVVGVLGAIMYRYHTALNARRADLQLGAERVALLVLESWKADGGSFGTEGFDPTDLDLINVPDLPCENLDISKSGTGYKVHLFSGVGGTDAWYFVELPTPIDTQSPNYIPGADDPMEYIRRMRVNITWALSGGEIIPTDSTALTMVLEDHVIVRY